MAAQSTESRELLGPLPAVRPVALDEDGQISIDMAMLPQAGQLVLVWVPYELGGPESIRHSSINTGLRGRFGYHPAVVNGIHIKDNCIELDIFVCRAFSFGTVSESVRYVENLDASIRKYFVPLSPTMPDDLSPTVPSEFGTSPLALGVGFMRDRPSWAMAVMTKLEIGVGQKVSVVTERILTKANGHPSSDLFQNELALLREKFTDYTSTRWSLLMKQMAWRILS